VRRLCFACPSCCEQLHVQVVRKIVFWLTTKNEVQIVHKIDVLVRHEIVVQLVHGPVVLLKHKITVRIMHKTTPDNLATFEVTGLHEQQSGTREI
jgi:hypothetical protein